LIDLHCHLDLYPEPANIARRCAEKGLYVLSVTTTPSAWPVTSRLARGRIRTALGLHPQLAHERWPELTLFDKLLPQVSYVGEVGLDGTPASRAHWGIQLKVFHHIFSSCERLGWRILSRHSSQANEAVLDCLDAHPDSCVPILHWFSGPKRDLYRAIASGCWFSVNPAMLVSKKGKELTIQMPRERVLTESDGPFAKIDGRTTLPWEVDQAVAVLADLWSTDPHSALIQLNQNLHALTVEQQKTPKSM